MHKCINTQEITVGMEKHTHLSHLFKAIFHSVCFSIQLLLKSEGSCIMVLLSMVIILLAAFWEIPAEKSQTVPSHSRLEQIKRMVRTLNHSAVLAILLVGSNLLCIHFGLQVYGVHFTDFSFCSIAADKGKRFISTKLKPYDISSSYPSADLITNPPRLFFSSALGAEFSSKPRSEGGWGFSWTFFFFEPFLNSNDIPQR